MASDGVTDFLPRSYGLRCYRRREANPCTLHPVRFELGIDDNKTVPVALAEFVTDRTIVSVPVQKSLLEVLTHRNLSRRLLSA